MQVASGMSDLKGESVRPAWDTGGVSGSARPPESFYEHEPQGVHEARGRGASRTSPY